MPDLDPESDYIFKPPPPKTAPPANLALKQNDDKKIETGYIIHANSAKYTSSKSPGRLSKKLSEATIQ